MKKHTIVLAYMALPFLVISTASANSLVTITTEWYGFVTSTDNPAVQVNDDYKLVISATLDPNDISKQSTNIINFREVALSSTPVLSYAFFDLSNGYSVGDTVTNSFSNWILANNISGQVYSDLSAFNGLGSTFNLDQNQHQVYSAFFNNNSSNDLSVFELTAVTPKTPIPAVTDGDFNFDPPESRIQTSEWNIFGTPTAYSLNLTAVPVPSTLWLLGTALIRLLGVKRKKL